MSMLVSPAFDPVLDSASGKVRRRKDKIRSAWIAFTGRIVAQVVGAGATVWLGLHVVQHGRLQTAPAVKPVASTDRPSLVVLPFENLSGDEGQAYLAEAVTDALIARLAESCSLRVVSRTTAASYANGRTPIAEIASDLGVNFVVEGAVVRTGDRVRVTTQLIDARSDAHVWTKTHDARLTDPIDLQDSVARAAAPDVLSVVSPPAQARRSTGSECANPSRS